MAQAQQFGPANPATGKVGGVQLGPSNPATGKIGGTNIAPTTAPTAQPVTPQNNQPAQLQVPTNPNAIGDYLKTYQSNIHQSITGKDLTGNNSDSVMGNAINQNRPTPPNLAATYGDLASKFGLTDLNKQMTDLVNQRNQIQESVKAAAAVTENQPGVTADVVAGREGEQQRLAQIQVDSKNLEISTLGTQITNANNTVGMIMQYTQQDYQNSEQAYNDSFTQAYQSQQLFMQQQQFGLQQEQFQFDQSKQAQQVATANWQVVSNLIASGKVDMSNLTPDQSAHIQSLETQAGLPSGITNMILSNTQAGSKIINVNPETGQAVIQMPNGKVSTMDIPGQTLPPVKLDNGYMYSYDPQAQQYKLIPGQVNILSQLMGKVTGHEIPETINATQNADTSKLDSLIEP